MDQTNPTVIIVGASRGLGLSLARLYAAENATVHATARNLTLATSLRELARAHHPNVILHTLEVRDDARRHELAESLAAQHVDLLIHSAGVNRGNVETQIAVNADAPMALLPLLVPSVLRGRGRLICIITSSMGTEAQLARRVRIGPERLKNYSVSKLAANTRFRAAEPAWRAQGITAVALNPGFVKTDMNNGKGQISAEASARAIQRVLRGKPRPLVPGSFVDYRGHVLSWQSGQPMPHGHGHGGGGRRGGLLHSGASSHGQALPPLDAAALGTLSNHRLGAPLPGQQQQHTSPMTSPWRPLIGRSVAELLQQTADPLGRLATGQYGAVVLRSFFSERDVRDTLHALRSVDARHWTSSAHKRATERRPTLHNGQAYNLSVYGLARLGPDLNTVLMTTRNMREYVRQVEQWQSTFRRLGLARAVRSLHAGLAELAKASGRAFSVGRDVRRTNASLGGGIFRRAPPGTVGFPLHFDSLRHSQRFYTERSCGKRDKKRRLPSSVLLGSAELVPDISRFDHQLSALLMLQRPDARTHDLELVDAHWGQLLHDCNVPMRPTIHNVHVNYVQPGWDYLQSLKRQWRNLDLELQPGDVYLFNANRLHLVPSIDPKGSQDRVTLGSFVGLDAGEVRLWA